MTITSTKSKDCIFCKDIVESQKRPSKKPLGAKSSLPSTHTLSSAIPHVLQRLIPECNPVTVCWEATATPAHIPKIQDSALKENLPVVPTCTFL